MTTPVTFGCDGRWWSEHQIRDYGAACRAASPVAPSLEGAWLAEHERLADAAIHAYAAWLAEFTTGDLQSLHVDRLNDEKDRARATLLAHARQRPALAAVQEPAMWLLPGGWIAYDTATVEMWKREGSEIAGKMTEALYASPPVPPQGMGPAEVAPPAGIAQQERSGILVGDTEFESWFADQPFATMTGVKQPCRDSYAAGHEEGWRDGPQAPHPAAPTERGASINDERAVELAKQSSLRHYVNLRHPPVAPALAEFARALLVEAAPAELQAAAPLPEALIMHEARAAGARFHQGAGQYEHVVQNHDEVLMSFAALRAFSRAIERALASQPEPAVLQPKEPTVRLVEAPAQYGNAAQFGVRGTSAPLSLSDAQAIAARYGAGIAYETRSGNYRTGEHHINPTRVCFTLEQLGALLADGHGVMVNEGGQKNG